MRHDFEVTFSTVPDFSTLENWKILVTADDLQRFAGAWKRPGKDLEMIDMFNEQSTEFSLA